MEACLGGRWVSSEMWEVGVGGTSWEERERGSQFGSLGICRGKSYR